MKEVNKKCLLTGLLINAFIMLIVYLNMDQKLYSYILALSLLLHIPAFHDVQHGTAVIVLAGIINSLKLVKKNKADMKIVINGSGAAGVAITKLLFNYGFKYAIMCDRKGIIYRGENGLNSSKIIGTGRSDFPNQVNNVLTFPGIFKGALQARCQISEKMKLAAAEAIASMVSDE